MSKDDDSGSSGESAAEAAEGSEFVSTDVAARKGKTGDDSDSSEE